MREAVDRMARPQKSGLNYFPLDVDIFSDRKIKILMARFGADGFTFYQYLLCEIYRDGYYLKADDDLAYIAGSDLNMDTDKIGQMLHFFLIRSLFDNTLYEADKVLTSAGIQRRYQEAMRSRASKRKVTVDGRFWVLSEEDTQDFIEVRHVDEDCGNNPSKSEKNTDKSENNSTNKNKGKENKGDEIKTEGEEAFGFPPAPLTIEEELIGTYGDKVYGIYLKKATIRGYTGDKAVDKARIWIQEDDAEGKLDRYYE